jgi:hypothetical protein
VPESGRSINNDRKDIMDRFAVYTPRQNAPADTRAAVANIDPKSAIVSAPDDPGQADRILIYYEGNRYGYAGVITFADRARIAAGRLKEQAPVIARAAVPRLALTQVAWFTPGHGVDVIGTRGLAALAKWLDLFHDGRIDSDTLAGELKLSR